jgi:hypothetical protein
VHTFANAGPRTVRLVNFNGPAGWEQGVRDLAAAAKGGSLTPEVIGPIASRYDFEAV